MAKLCIEGVTKRFGDHAAVKDLSLEIQEGEAVVLLGPSGCGKTTLLKLIAGFLKPDGGRILMDDQVLSTPQEILPPDRRQMSMVFQSYAIWPHKTVFQNVAYGLEVRRMSREVIRTKVLEGLALVRLEGLERRYSTELSGGQQQRVALARALVVEPSILLLDEPLSNLDANLRMEMRAELGDLQKKLGITFVYVTHDQAEAMVLGDRIVLMKEGEKVQVGRPEELYGRPHDRFAATFVGSSNIVEGEVEEAGGGDRPLRVRTPFGSVALSASSVSRPMAKGQGVLLCARPEWVELLAGPDPSRANLYPAKVVRRIYYGKHIEYLVALGETEFIVETSSAWDRPVGSEVFVHLPPERCTCVEKR